MYIITSAISGTLGFLFLVVWIVLTLFTLTNILRSRGAVLTLGNKILWIVIIVVVPILGSLIYMFWKRVKAL